MKQEKKWAINYMMITKQLYHSGTKYEEYFFIRDEIIKPLIDLKYIESIENVDFRTKPVIDIDEMYRGSKSKKIKKRKR